MGPLDVERFFYFPAARRINRRPRAARINDLKVGGGDSELRVEHSQIHRGVGIVISVHDGDGAASTHRQHSGYGRRATSDRRGESIHAGQRSRRLKKAGAARAARWSNAAFHDGANSRARAASGWAGVPARPGTFAALAGACTRQRARRHQRLSQLVEQNVRMRPVTDVLGSFDAGTRDHNASGDARRLSESGGKHERHSACDDHGGKGEFHEARPALSVR